MRWECGAPSWAWCSCVPGTNCGKRWKATRRWRREGLHERKTGRKSEASGRTDALALYRAATGSRPWAGSFRAHAGMRHLPHVATGAGARIAAADSRDAGRRRANAFAAGAIPGAGAQVHAMDLGISFRSGGNGGLRTLYGICPALGTATGASGIRGVEPAELADLSGRNVERMAIHDHTPRSAGDGDAGGTGSHVLPPANTARFGAGAGLRRVVHRAGDAHRSVGNGASPRGTIDDRERLGHPH